MEKNQSPLEPIAPVGLDPIAVTALEPITPTGLDPAVFKLVDQIVKNTLKGTFVSLLPRELNRSLFHWLTVERGLRVDTVFTYGEEQLVEELFRSNEASIFGSYKFIQYYGYNDNVGLPSLPFDYSYVKNNPSNGVHYEFELLTMNADSRTNYGLTLTEVKILESLRDSDYPIAVVGNSLNAVRKIYGIIRSNLTHPVEYNFYNKAKELGEVATKLGSELNDPEEIFTSRVIIESSNDKDSLTELRKLSKYIMVNVFEKQGSIYFHIKPVIGKTVIVSKDKFNTELPLLLLINRENSKVYYEIVTSENIPSTDIETEEDLKLLMAIYHGRMQALALYKKKTFRDTSLRPMHVKINAKMIVNDRPTFDELFKHCRSLGILITIEHTSDGALPDYLFGSCHTCVKVEDGELIYSK